MGRRFHSSRLMNAISFPSTTSETTRVGLLTVYIPLINSIVGVHGTASGNRGSTEALQGISQRDGSIQHHYNILPLGYSGESSRPTCVKLGAVKIPLSTCTKRQIDIAREECKMAGHFKLQKAPRGEGAMKNMPRVQEERQWTIRSRTSWVGRRYRCRFWRARLCWGFYS